MGARIIARWLRDGRLQETGLADLPDPLPEPLWVDVTDPDEPAIAALSARFALPPLAAEDCLHFPQRPKLDVYPDLTFAIWLLPEFDDEGAITSAELDLFLGAEHLITLHHGEVQPVALVAEAAASYLERGVEWTIHAILDQAVDAVFPLVERLSDDLEDLEDLMLTDARPAHLQRLYAAKRSLVQLHKVVGPERDVIRGLARLEVFIVPEAYMYFQDIGDHLARVADQIDTYREVAAGTMDIYLSAQSNRLNQVMKQLTVVATIFMPLTLISGIYGMNFQHMPELSWRFGYAWALALMVGVAVAMVWYFRRKDWW